MSGDSHTHDDDDFLDEDFVVEDIVGKNDELEDLFEQPSAQREAQAAARREAAAPDEEDALFTDHTEGLQAGAVFEGRGQFSEQAASDWNGERLELEEDEQLDAAAGATASGGRDLEADFVDDLADDGATLSSEEDFALDSEAELELVDVGGGEAAAADEFEQSATFSLDGDDETWTEDAAAARSVEDELFADEEVHASPYDTHGAEMEQIPSTAEVLEPFDDESALEPAGLDASMLADEEELETLPLLDSADEAAALEQGWEPLPRVSVDGLSEVEEVEALDGERVYDTSGYEEDEPVEQMAQPAADNPWGLPPEEEPDLEDIEGHDIYAEDEEEEELVVLGGREPARGRVFGLLVSLAASVSILATGAVVVMRPQWLGLSFEPERVERVAIQRPKVEIVVAEPPAPTVEVLAGADPVVETAPTVPQDQPEGGAPTTPEQLPGGTEGGALAQTGPGTQTTGTGNPGPDRPEGEPADTGTTEPELPVVAVGTAPVGSAPGGTAPADAPATVAPLEGGTAWPVVMTSPTRPGQGTGRTLARLGDDLMAGEFDPTATGASRAVDGVMPGSRAFAQLHNGNFFIGSIKTVGENSVTLRVESGGEVTIANAEIAQLTSLASRDYDELQRATKGTVRLTNNNRLVGGILSRIADDHVVLEFRKNRVMLPKSVVGEIVSGDEESGVRLDTTREEDDWLRTLIERQVGTGRGAEAQDPPTSSPPR